ncbi:MAG: hypothetical protein U9O59_01590 [Actinomycetota bacterium]|nr:hypothetical protein [Actinomycetota bacterium]
MSKVVLMIAGVILAILGILTLIPAIPMPSLLLAIILIVAGILIFILSLMEKRRA